MLDKIVIAQSRKEAFFIFTDRTPIRVASDIDVVPILMWLLGYPNAHLVVNPRAGIVTIELRRDCGEEITMKIKLDDVA